MIKSYEFGGHFKRVKTCPNGPKVIFLLIKTYFLEYLRSERSPAARRCACFPFALILSLILLGVFNSHRAVNLCHWSLIFALKPSFTLPFRANHLTLSGTKNQPSKEGADTIAYAKCKCHQLFNTNAAIAKKDTPIGQVGRIVRTYRHFIGRNLQKEDQSMHTMFY